MGASGRVELLNVPRAEGQVLVKKAPRKSEIVDEAGRYPEFERRVGLLYDGGVNVGTLYVRAVSGRVAPPRLIPRGWREIRTLQTYIRWTDGSDEDRAYFPGFGADDSLGFSDVDEAVLNWRSNIALTGRGPLRVSWLTPEDAERDETFNETW